MIALTNPTVSSGGDISPFAPGAATGEGDHSSVRSPAGMPKTKTLIVVLGMHRSGTSLLANLLTTLGVNLGEKLLQADCNNEAGYWEQEEIYRAQDELLKKLGRPWIGVAGTVPLPSDWWKLPEVQPFKERLASILREEIAKTNTLWGFKDPRSSRLLPLWKEIFAELGVKPIYLLAIRDPAEVVESVVRRDEIPASRAELLWLLHNLDAVRDSGDQLRLVVDYGRWFTHPKEQAQAVARAVGLEWPANEAALLADMQQRIRPNLRHCRAQRPFSLPLVAETFAALKSAASSGQIPRELQQLDRDARRAISLCEPWASVIEDFTRPCAEEPYSFVEHFSEARFEPFGPAAQSALWDALIDGPMHRALFLHPPARLYFRVPNGRRARLTFAVGIHPLAWSKPNAGGCEFIVTANETIRSSVKVDPVRIASDRRWHECALDLPENPDGSHEVVFETRQWGDCLDFRWAVWRNPQLTWLEDAPPPPSAALEPEKPAPATPSGPTDSPIMQNQKSPFVSKPALFNSTGGEPHRKLAVEIEPAPIGRINGHPSAPAARVSAPHAELQSFHDNATDYFADVVPPQLSETHLRHSRIVPCREDILPLMPKGGVCAEVGTQTGGFAKLIFSILRPAKLHIYDISYRVFDHAHFADSIRKGIVELHQGDSSTLLGALPDRYFDFIYIDGDHSYDGIVKDLAQAARKIKDDGWIVCNDYTIYSPLEKTKYGVYRAVNEFCINQGFEIIYLGLHKWGHHDVALKKRTI